MLPNCKPIFPPQAPAFYSFLLFPRLPTSKMLFFPHSHQIIYDAFKFLLLEVREHHPWTSQI